MPIGVQDTTRLEYPKKPFSDELAEQIANLPEGFKDLANSGVISIQIIQRLALSRGHTVLLASRAAMDRESSTVLRQKFTSLEQMIWQAFSVFHLCTTTYKPDREELAEAFLRCEGELTGGTQAENDCLLWGGCVIATTKEMEGWELVQRKTVTEIVLKRFKMDIGEMNAVSRKFLWNDSMSLGLSAILQHKTISVSMDGDGPGWRIFL